MNKENRDLSRFANSFADISNKILKKRFLMKLDIEKKKDGSFVTNIDKEIELVFREKLNKAFSTHNVLGEEFGFDDKKGDFTWVIDPLDGTHNFIAGKPLFGTLISCLKNNVPVFGMIDIPILDQRWSGGKKIGVKLNNKKLDPFCIKKKYEDIIVSSTSLLMFNDKYQIRIKDIYSKIGFPVFGCDCYSYGLLLSGKIDQVIEAQMKPWDFLAQVALINEHGGIITDWNGNELNIESDGKIIASIEKNHHKRTLKYLNK